MLAIRTEYALVIARAAELPGWVVPIPELRTVQNWQEVLIQSVDEPLVSVSRLRTSRVQVQPMYFLRGVERALSECYVRAHVADLLGSVAESLPNGYKLLVWDAWRPFEVQEALYDDLRTSYANEHPFLDGEELDALVAKYVSVPSNFMDRPAPHITGGAVDLSLADNFGIPMRMGTEFDYFGAEAATRHYEEARTQGPLSEDEQICMWNRRLLFWAMARAGFTNYAEEWWHFDFGNQFWARICERSALYGIADLPNSEPA